MNCFADGSEICQLMPNPPENAPLSEPLATLDLKSKRFRPLHVLHLDYRLYTYTYEYICMHIDYMHIDYRFMYYIYTSTYVY